MKTITYLCLGAAALCGIAIATPQPGQQLPVERSAAASATIQQGPQHPRVTALGALYTPAVAVAGPAHPRASALGAAGTGLGADAGPAHPRSATLDDMRAPGAIDAEAVIVAGR